TPPSSGTVHLDSVDVTQLPPHRRAARGIGRTFQIARLFPELSALDNVRVGVAFAPARPPGREAQRRRAAELLELVGLESKAAALGEQKRLELAVALGPAPRLLLLDEVAAGLPPRGRDEVVGLYAQLRARGVTIVAIEHALGLLAELADRIVVLDQGEVIADG